MKKFNGAILALSIVAAAMSTAALVLSIIALVKSLGRNRIADSEFDFYDASDLQRDYDDLPEEDDVGSDTLAF